jgi:hypothetical protein
VGLFLIFMGIAGTVLALPAWQNVMSLIPGTYLRSPARLAYLTELAIAIGLAVFVERARNGTLCHGALHRAMRVIVPVLLAAHVAELWWFDRSFVARVPRPPQPTAAQVDELVRVVGDGRAGIDVEADVPVNREVDDLGFFDSIMLARPYTTFLELGGVPQGANWQDVSAAQLDRRALSAAGSPAARHPRAASEPRAGRAVRRLPRLHGSGRRQAGGVFPNGKGAVSRVIGAPRRAGQPFRERVVGPAATGRGAVVANPRAGQRLGPASRAVRPTRSGPH